ncbi:MAG: hypothetical protein K2W80_11010 [Burkholderiales bacterium]|nr:hypothetical protein [Burkholderiales bacterium]
MDIGPSRRLAAAVVGGHALAASAVAAAGLPLPAALVLLLVVGVSGAHCLRQQACVSSAGAIVRLEVDGHGKVGVQYRNGYTASGMLSGSTVVGWRLTLVRFRIDGDYLVRTVALLGDNCSATPFRRLRTGLAWQAGAALRS